jgi:hypothetical protein
LAAWYGVVFRDIAWVDFDAAFAGAANRVELSPPPLRLAAASDTSPIDVRTPATRASDLELLTPPAAFRETVGTWPDGMGYRLRLAFDQDVLVAGFWTTEATALDALRITTPDEAVSEKPRSLIVQDRLLRRRPLGPDRRALVRVERKGWAVEVAVDGTSETLGG